LKRKKTEEPKRKMLYEEVKEESNESSNESKSEEQKEESLDKENEIFNDSDAEDSVDDLCDSSSMYSSSSSDNDYVVRLQESDEELIAAKIREEQDSRHKESDKLGCDSQEDSDNFERYSELHKSLFEEILEEREAPRHLDKQEPETLGLEPDTAKPTIIKLQKNSSKIMQDNALKQKLKNRNPYEKYIDIALSGTSGTVVV